MTKEQKHAKALILNWCKAQKMSVQAVAHIYPRVYVIARTAPQCLIVSRPWQDAEPQVKRQQQEHPVSMVRLFDSSLRTGDWCVTAYICTPSSGQDVAVALTPTNT